MGHSETTGGTKIGILESASRLDVSCVFVPKSSFFIFIQFEGPRLAPKWFKLIPNAIIHIITNN